MEPKVLETFDRSLARCDSREGFLERFYERFFEMSPKVAEKFANTDFVRQKRALRASFHMMLVVAGDPDEGPRLYMRELARTHSKAHHDIGAEFYDYWLNALLATVREYDEQWDHDVENAWEQVMSIGIDYLLSHYNDPPEA